MGSMHNRPTQFLISVNARELDYLAAGLESLVPEMVAENPADFENIQDTFDDMHLQLKQAEQLT